MIANLLSDLANGAGNRFPLRGKRAFKDTKLRLVDITIMRTWSSISALTLAPADAGLLDMRETPLGGAGAILAGLSGIRDTGGSLIASRIAASMSASEAAASTEAE
jgi:hypothetical protein